ncbi:hypothetical protein HB364_18430 [Pseudoflavitalea sp. X16]|uniref:hypothetical protein n=1 Tax=Paraflavitalea devenefica TaxID=2716334 RepID=UPI00141E570E|nr:hypothetical protein [Paraflavitalea devenefica]NII27073.1 hypothetical protein [Paraflavitalea devenefica]
MLKLFRGIFKDYFWDFYRWAQQVPFDTPLAEVKAQLPLYAKVDWANPAIMGKGLLYPVIWIKGYKKRQKALLGFVDGLYTGCVIRG